MLAKLYSILILAIVICNTQGEKKWEVGDEHLKKIFGKESFDNGKIPNHKVVYAYPREDNSRSRRQVDSNELLYIIESFDEILNLTLFLNSKLFSRSSVVQLYSNGTLQTIDNFPKNCYYFGQIDGDPNSRVAVSLCGDEMVGVVEASNGSYLVEPLSGGAHIAYDHKVKQSNLPLVENIGGADDDGALPCPKLDDPENGEVMVDGYHPGSSATYQCAEGFRHVGPQVRQCLPTALWSGSTPVCVATDIAVIATGGAPALMCPSLSDPRWGSVTVNYNTDINTYEAVYHCEDGKSINGDERRYCSDNTRRWSGQEPTCIPDEMLDLYINGLGQGGGSKRKRRQEVGETLSMEIMVFVDGGVVAFHGSDIIVNYIMAIMNIMASLYKDPTLRIPIDVVISRLIIEEAESSGLDLSEDASEALNTFCQFQFSLNSEDESSAFHHDHAILITSVDICGQDSSGSCNNGVIGFAPVGGMCSFSRSCTINEDRGLGTAFVLAHETGHNLGMQHDGFLNDCTGSQRIMAASAGGQAELFRWSSCSADYLEAFIDENNGVCLEDPPIGGKLNASALEGLNFDADAQCRAIYGATARFCPATIALQELCSRLWCQPNVGQGCFTRNIPPADGTSCGEDLICVRGSCEDIDSVVVPIDGGWSSFGPYSQCSRTCESGVKFRERQCNNPTAEFGGRFCEGESREYEVCNTDACPDGAVNFRDVQCADTNDTPFGGELLTWESFKGEFPPEVTPCQLYCQTEDGSVTNVRASSVIDGTKCVSHESPSAVCIQGSCTPLGCDNILNSDAREDICGVCNGNDSNATTISDSASGSSEVAGYVNVGLIPSGARDITIMEMSTSAAIALRQGNTDILNGEFEIFSPGSYIIEAEDFTFVYNVSSSTGTDVVFISGPLSEQLFIRAFVFTEAGPYTVSWEYKICDAPLPSMTSSVSEPTSTTVASTTTLSTTISPSSTTSISTTQSTRSTILTESTSVVVLSTTSTSQQSTTIVRTTTSFSTTSIPVMTPTLTTVVPSSTTTPSSSSVTSSTSPTRTSTTSTVSSTKTTTSVAPTTSSTKTTTSVAPTTSSTKTTTSTVSSTKTTTSVVPTTSSTKTTTSVVPTTSSTKTTTSTVSSTKTTTSVVPTISSTKTTTSTVSSTKTTTSVVPTTSSTKTTTSVVPTTSSTKTTTSVVPTTSSTRVIITPTPDPTPIDCRMYDLCGVCNGDDSSADVVTGSSSQHGTIGYYDAVTIPLGARHIMVYEDPPTTDNFIALAVNGESILNGHFRIKSSTTFTDNGATFTYVRSPEESVTTPGPLSQPLTVQALIGVSRGTYSLSWSYVMCEGVVAPTSSSTTTSSSSSPVTPTPEILYPLWGYTRYGRCSLNDGGVCERSREVFCTDGLTNMRLNSDDLCAARREKPSTTLRCGARICQWQTNEEKQTATKDFIHS